jgi:hypothetical protein
MTYEPLIAFRKTLWEERCGVIPGFLGNAKFFKILLFRIKRFNTGSRFMSITDEPVAVKSKMFAKYSTLKRFKQFSWKYVLFCFVEDSYDDVFLETFWY